MADESNTTRKSQLLPRLLIFMAVVTVGLIVASAAFAGWVTINTDNNQVDVSAWSTAWPTSPYSASCANPSITDNNEIKSVWYGSDGTYIHFRLQVCGTTALGSDTGLRAVAGIDCNADGDFTDGYTPGNYASGDRLIVYVNDGSDLVQVVDGQSQPVINAPNATYAEKVPLTPSGANRNTIEWKIDINALYPACRASLSTVKVGFTTVRVAPTPAATVDFVPTAFDWYSPLDFGDHYNPTATPAGFPPVSQPCATANYGTRLGCNGARHGFGPTPDNPLRLGSALTDPDGGDLQGTPANGDDINGTTPDDEGVYPDPANAWNDTNGRLVLSLAGGTNGLVTCWVDFNKDQDWLDSGERVVTNQGINNATTGVNITLPSTGKSFPNTYPARCRLFPQTTNLTPQPFGPYQYGEVEDHNWEFDANGVFIGQVDVTPTPSPTPSPTPTNTPQTPVAITNLAIARDATPANAKLTWTNPAPNDSVRVYSNPVNPYFTPADVNAVDRGVVANPTAQFIESGVLGDTTVQTIYYIVLGRVGIVESGPSNRVGLFEFSLIPGLP